jgi:hypothetical protein
LRKKSTDLTKKILKKGLIKTKEAFDKKHRTRQEDIQVGDKPARKFLTIRNPGLRALKDFPGPEG